MNKISRHYMRCVATHVYRFLHGAKNIQFYRSKLLGLYNNSSFQAWIMLKVVLPGICLFHIVTYDYWFILSHADVFTSRFVPVEGQFSVNI